jgi:D-arabinose 1-dehydrogenase-like Zn-dependent alcohol dehydrogenase
MAKMKVALVPKPGADFEIVEREIPNPTAGHVRIRVQACGICHSDSLVKEGYWPGIQYPRAPGHEVAGVIDDVGSGVTGWKKGQRVGVGWHGGQDGTCLPCRRGDFANCRNAKICGISFDGGYQEYMIAPVEALAAMPESLDAVEAGPLLCAGVTTFNALATAAHCLQTSLPSKASAASGISEFSLPINLGTESPPSAAVPRKLLSPRNSARTCILTAKQPTRRKNSRNSAALA